MNGVVQTYWKINQTTQHHWPHFWSNFSVDARIRITCKSSYSSYIFRTHAQRSQVIHRASFQRMLMRHNLCDIIGSTYSRLHDSNIIYSSKKAAVFTNCRIDEIDQVFWGIFWDSETKPLQAQHPHPITCLYCIYTNMYNAYLGCLFVHENQQKLPKYTLIHYFLHQRKQKWQYVTYGTDFNIYQIF